MNTPSKRPTIGWVCRFFWSMFGPMLMLFLTLTILLQDGNGWFTYRDVLFAVILLAIIVCRWADFRHGGRTDAYGEPVAVSDLRRYTLIWAVVGGITWVGAHLVGNYLL